MGKLVRDQIPELFGERSGVLDTEHFRAALRSKLREEVDEYLESGVVLELADVLEVVCALARFDGVDTEPLETLRRQ